jgi:hypothetical protein
MAGLVPAIHAFPSELRLPQPASPIGPKVVDDRHKAGHDGLGRLKRSVHAAASANRTAVAHRRPGIGIAATPYYPRRCSFLQSIRIEIMRISLGILMVCYGLALAGCEAGQATNPNTCLADGSVAWWVTPNKEGQVKDTATMQNCAATNNAWQQPAK